jgi:hypothetical protein
MKKIPTSDVTVRNLFDFKVLPLSNTGEPGCWGFKKLLQEEPLPGNFMVVGKTGMGKIFHRTVHDVTAETKQVEQFPSHGTKANGAPCKIFIDELWMWHLSRESRKS